MASLEQIAREGQRLTEEEKKQLRKHFLQLLLDEDPEKTDRAVRRVFSEGQAILNTSHDEYEEAYRIFKDRITSLPEGDDYDLSFASRALSIDEQRLTAILDHGAVHDTEKLRECYSTEYPDYVILARLGDGAAKVAYLARNKYSDAIRVLLMMQPTENWKQYHRKVNPGLSDDELVQRIHKVEFSGDKLQHIQHPNVLAFSPPKRGKDQHGKKAYFFETLPYEKRLDIKFSGEPVDTNTKLKYILGIAKGLLECHRRGIVHKDLSPKNIGIMPDDDCVLTDFGYLSVFSSGNPQYFYPRRLMPPELAKPTKRLMKERGKNWRQDLFTPEVNIWTVGAIAYWMFTGRDLFHVNEKRAAPSTKKFDKQNDKLNRLIQAFPSRREAVLAELEQIHPYARAIAGLCLQMEPEMRTGALERIVDLLDGSTKLAGGGMVKFDTRDVGGITERSYLYRSWVKVLRYDALKEPSVKSSKWFSTPHLYALRDLMAYLQSQGEKGVDTVYAILAERTMPIPVGRAPLAVHLRIERDGIPLTYHKHNKTFYLDFFDPRFPEFQRRVGQQKDYSSKFHLAIIDREYQNNIIYLWPTNFDIKHPTSAPRLFV
ncbi:protein kinase [Candidatus Woesearchaeota archaeon]|nr:protein kinase [Candidatus Woesearchaeota archaeon]